MGRGVVESRLGSVDRRRGDDDVERQSPQRERAIGYVSGDDRWVGCVGIGAREKDPRQTESAWSNRGDMSGPGRRWTSRSARIDWIGGCDQGESCGCVQGLVAEPTKEQGRNASQAWARPRPGAVKVVGAS